MEFLKKIGTTKDIYSILTSAGWNGSYFKFATQKHRKSLKTDTALILWDWCQKHGIEVSLSDFTDNIKEGKG